MDTQFTSAAITIEGGFPCSDDATIVRRARQQQIYEPFDYDNFLVEKVFYTEDRRTADEAEDDLLKDSDKAGRRMQSTTGTTPPCDPRIDATCEEPAPCDPATDTNCTPVEEELEKDEIQREAFRQRNIEVVTSIVSEADFDFIFAKLLDKSEEPVNSSTDIPRPLDVDLLGAVQMFPAFCGEVAEGETLDIFDVCKIELTAFWTYIL